MSSGSEGTLLLFIRPNIITAVNYDPVTIALSFIRVIYEPEGGTRGRQGYM
jgi:hypothetical protein